MKQDEVPGMDMMGISLQVFLYPPAYCISGLASTTNLHLGGDGNLFERCYSKAVPLCGVSKEVMGAQGGVTHGFGLGRSERPISYFVYTVERLQ